MNGYNNEKVIFERSNNNITYGNYFSEKTKNKLNQYTLDFINKNNMLLLKFLNTDKDSLYEYEKTNILKEIYQWFLDDLNILEPNSILITTEDFKIKQQILKLTNYLKYFDTGIERIETKPLTFRLRNEEEKKLNEMLTKIKNNVANKFEKITSLFILFDDLYLITISKTCDISIKTVLFIHKDEKEYEMNFRNESKGTKRIIELSMILLNDEENKLFVVDELDNSLHPKLTSKFVELFLKNNNNNQLLVTTHESRLLDQDLLRRDEVWFVSKVSNKSNLYSLEEYNVRFDKKIDKAYLEGRYGGIPLFDIELLEKN